MKESLIVLLVLAAALLQVGCGNDLTGTTWVKTQSEWPASYSLTFTNKLKSRPPTYFGSGGGLTLIATVDGNTVTLVGIDAKGKISGKKMIFPESNSVMANYFAGEWIKQ